MPAASAAPAPDAAAAAAPGAPVPTPALSASPAPGRFGQLLDGPLTEQELEAMLERELEGGYENEEGEEDEPVEEGGPNLGLYQRQAEQLLQEQQQQPLPQLQQLQQQQVQQQQSMEPIDIDRALAAIESEDIQLRGQVRAHQLLASN